MQWDKCIWADTCAPFVLFVDWKVSVESEEMMLGSGFVVWFARLPFSTTKQFNTFGLEKAGFGPSLPKFFLLYAMHFNTQSKCLFVPVYKCKEEGRKTRGRNPNEAKIYCSELFFRWQTYHWVSFTLQTESFSFSSLCSLQKDNWTRKELLWWVPLQQDFLYHPLFCPGCVRCEF